MNTAMIKILKFAKQFKIQQQLHYYPGIWAVDSELTTGLSYGISDGKFAVIRHDGIAYCPLDEVDELAAKMKPEVGDEILNVFALWKETR